MWLSWFLSLVLTRFAPLCEAERRERYMTRAAACAAAANAAWDGDWFLRGYYDDGGKLGSRESDECRIDSIAQSFAAFCSLADREKARHGVGAAVERLFDRTHGVVKLFAPPFDFAGQDPGYIQGYLPGVRENGGQYTHGAVWLAMACLETGLGEEGYALLRAILPENHDPARYQGEPYVIAADVYANPQHMGRGGWSWYTGAAGWYYRAAVEHLLGLVVREGVLFFEPKLPDAWRGFSADWSTGGALLHIRVERTGVASLTLDGVVRNGGISLGGLVGEHEILFSY